MASYPLGLYGFLDILPVQDVVFELVTRTQANNMASGEILVSEVAPPQWQGSFSLAPMPARDADDILTKIEDLQNPGASFKAYKKNQIGPRLDPICDALSGFSPVLAAFAVDGTSVRLSGLPDGYVMSRGDLISFDYDAGRRALHRCMETLTAPVGGLETADIDIQPPLRPGAVVLTSVLLKRAWCKALLVPGSLSAGTTRGGITSGIAFSWRQTLR